MKMLFGPGATIACMACLNGFKINQIIGPSPLGSQAPAQNCIVAPKITVISVQNQ